MLNETRNQASTDMRIEGIEAIVSAFHDYFSPWKLTGKINQTLGGILRLPFRSSLSQHMRRTGIHRKWSQRYSGRFGESERIAESRKTHGSAHAICPTS